MIKQMVITLVSGHVIKVDNCFAEATVATMPAHLGCYCRINDVKSVRFVR